MAVQVMVYNTERWCVVFFLRRLLSLDQDLYLVIGSRLDLSCHWIKTSICKNPGPTGKECFASPNAFQSTGVTYAEVVDAYFKQVRTIWWWMLISNRCVYHMVVDAYFKQVCV
jgi:hypothetical protein